MRVQRAADTIISVDPFRCRPWALHDRLDEQITAESCRDEIESVRKHGQLVPALGRKLQNEPMYEVEVVCGARRLFVARYLKVALRIELREMTDRDAIVAMDIENRQRQDISAYERGLSYARWLREGYFSSQEDIASALKISGSQVSRLLKIARLPPVVLNAFPNVGDICESWGLEIAAALEDAEKRGPTISVAREISRGEQRFAAPEVRRRLLMANAPGRKPAARRRPEVVLDDDGSPLFRVRHECASVALLLPLERISAPYLKEICGEVKAILQKQAARRTRVKGSIGPHLAADACNGAEA